jgi:alpha-mannosidase
MIAFILPAILGLHTAQPIKPDLTKDPTLYIVGYAHLDTQWRWSFPQTIGEFLPNTMHDNFKLFEQYPNYTFNFTGSNRYRLMKEYWPEDYARMKDYIAKGRWFPAGSSVEEGDVNSPSLESLVRQVLYGNEFFDKEFGTHSDEYMLPDCFGFPAALPSILAHCGVKGFSTQKLTWGSAVGIPFNLGVWEGPDGKSVVAALNPGSYGSEIKGDLSQDASWTKRVNDDGAKTGVFADYMYYGTGDVGGSPAPASVGWAEKSITGTGSLKIVGGRADNLFNALTPDEVAKLPRYKGDLELTQHSAGSLSSESEHKRWNHENEKLAQAAEEAAVAARVVGNADYPSDKLLNAWYLFLAGQFHDTMAGTALPKAYQYAWNDDCIALNEFASTMHAGVATVARGLDTTGAGLPIIVFNPTSIQRSDLVDATVYMPGVIEPSFIVTPSGKKEPAQIISSQNGHVHVVFQAEAPSISFGVYRLVVGTYTSPKTVIAHGRTLENSHLKATISASGDISSVYDKRDKREVLAAPIRLALMHENPENWPAWNMDWADQQKAPYGYVDGPADIKVVESGPVRGAIRISRSAQGSRFVQEVRLGEDSDRLEFADSIDWKTKETALKQEFNLAAANPIATYNWQVGTVQRPNNDPKKYEVASHRWFDLTDTSGAYGASVLTGCKIGSDKPDDHTVRLTLLYSPGIHGGYQDQYSQDWGHHEISYGFMPHSGAWSTSGTSTQAVELDQPMYAFQTEPHHGESGRQISLASVDNPHISIVALKKAENGDDYIVRVRENDAMSHSSVSLRFATPAISAQQVDGQERPLGDAQVANGAAVFDLGPYAVKAFEVKLSAFNHPVSASAAQPVDLPYNQDVISMPDKVDDGDFDGHGRTLAGDQLPDNFQFMGIPFKVGPKGVGEKNAVACEGQSVPLPAGDWHSIHILAASSDGPQPVSFAFGTNGFSFTVADWGGFYGQWDTRIWRGEVPKMAYDWSNELLGIQPAHIRRDRIAWNCSHRHDPQGNEIYQYSYLYDYTLPVKQGETSLTLGNDPKVKILAMTMSSEGAEPITEANHVVDTIHEELDAPVITPGKGTFKDSTFVTITPGLYGRSDQISYQINGDPKRNYQGPIEVSANASITAQVGQGPEAHVSIDVNDVTPPSVTEAKVWPDLAFAQVKFSEPVNKNDAENAANYLLPGFEITGAHLHEDGRTVALALKSAARPTTTITIKGIRDLSPRENKFSGTAPLETAAPAVSIPDYVGQGKSLVRREPTLPLDGKAPWTINFFVKTDKMPDDLTPIAGFGQSDDSVDGASRYICKFENGIQFWGRNVDIGTNTPLDLNQWQMLTATYDGSTVTVYKNGKKLTSRGASLTTAPAVVKISPLDGWDHKRRFQGEVKNFTIWSTALDEGAVGKLYELGVGGGQ